MSKAVDAFVADALRKRIQERLELCTEAQRANVPNIFPRGFDTVNESNLRSALALVERTLASNAQKAGA